ncbi:MAG: glutathione S-transferase family protein [Alphaproteobacteria bacterium]|nr:glutathione S-transferase family protein [Alphaproteobacteria bacterium]MBU1550032.1 glutathione S-transferase family protein [Alphaproteobacteria bacterium]MBU2337166.1 glutathione S-transferase family protein [Alphaproteobacteria bacterium]MBU2389497.1 glutathione S-transferase family protein [Alphaproteobacteria bacterium]
MTDDLVLYTNPMSRGRIARWMLEEVGVPYTAEVIPFGPVMKAPDYRVINPMGKVPALRHGQHVITECAAICAYLADAFPQAGLAPPTMERADYYRWMFFAAGPLEASVTNRSLGVEVPPDKRGMIGYGSHSTMLEMLEKAVTAKAFVAGEHFSAADVYVGSHIGWGLQIGSLETRPAFTDYLARVTERPAYRRARDLNDAEMKALQATG